MSDFWSRRRALVTAEADSLAAQAELDRREAEDAALADISDDELLTALELPQPEMVDTAELLQRFMRSALPKHLKQRALRQYWRRKPVLACLDGLVDYAGDYTDAATSGTNLQTSYQVGKGLLAHVEALAKSAETEEDAPRAETDPAPEIFADADAEMDENLAPEESAPEQIQRVPQTRPASARRMRFRFEETA